MHGDAWKERQRGGGNECFEWWFLSKEINSLWCGVNDTSWLSGWLISFNKLSNEATRWKGFCEGVKGKLMLRFSCVELYRLSEQESLWLVVKLENSPRWVDEKCSRLVGDIISWCYLLDQKKWLFHKTNGFTIVLSSSVCEINAREWFDRRKKIRKTWKRKCFSSSKPGDNFSRDFCSQAFNIATSSSCCNSALFRQEDSNELQHFRCKKNHFKIDTFEVCCGVSAIMSD